MCTYLMPMDTGIEKNVLSSDDSDSDIDFDTFDRIGKQPKSKGVSAFYKYLHENRRVKNCMIYPHA